MPRVEATIRVFEDRCKGCGYCVLYCNPRCIEMSHDFNIMGYHYPVLIASDGCTGCENCGRMCPDVALEVYRGQSRARAA